MEDKEGKTSCEDAVYQRLAYEENHLDYCNKMESSLGKDRCLDGVSYQIAVKQGCGEKTGIEPSVCEAIQTLERVIASQDPSQCMNIFQENDRSVCLEAIGSGDRDHDDLTGDQETRFGTSDTNPDTDGDGLTDKDEIMVWGTNPLVSDSDGDHFTDAEEVQGGYNPLGAGRL
ncbi:MAG: Fibronectin type III domain protein [Candidatus Uhrbacteria bacterium GW2011_GWA2_41_10]|nr:MAG: Fibronectin type III domain protein [Candidatus Uhrbacteria bacterium GW2011_GWA2_41_10]